MTARGAAPLRRSWAAQRARKRAHDSRHLNDWHGPGPVLRLAFVMLTGNLVLLLVTQYADLPTWLMGLVLVAGGIGLSDLGFVLSRRWHMVQPQAGDGQSSVFGVVGTLYAVLVAFAIIVVWQNYTTAQATVSTEANAVSDLDRLSRTYPVPIRRQVQEAARTYVTLIIQDEWPLMEHSRSSPRAYASLVELWNTYTDMAPRLHKDALHDKSVGLLNTMDDNRNLRLQAAGNGVPTTMWVLLYGGTVSTVMLCYFFVSPRGEPVARFRVLLLSGVNYLSLFLIAALADPFRGSLEVTPASFEFVLSHLQHLET
jgi:hypothetical protein